MRPTTLTIEGFQSYLEPQTIDFTTLTAASITGEVGAGKTTIIDAITYALYGEVRATGDKTSVMHTRSKKLIVELDFTMDDAQWRIRRTSTRGKKTATSKAYFHKLDPATGEWQTMGDGSGNIGPTNRAILDVIGLNFDAFRATALVEQGNSGAFAQADPATRHRIFANIIDLGKYAAAEERARQERTTLTRERDTITARIDTHNDALTERDATKRNLADAKERHTKATQQVTDAEKAVQTAATEVEKITAQWHEAAAAKKAREQHLSAAREALEHAQYRATTARNTLAAATKAETDARARLDELEREIAAADRADRDAAAQLEADTARAQATVNDAPAQQRKLDRADNTLTAATRKIEETREATHALRERGAGLQSRLGDLTAKRDAARQAYNEEKARLNKLREAHNHGQSECYACGQSLDPTLMDRMAHDLTARMDKITREGTHYVKQIADAQQQLTDFTGQIDTLQQQLTETQQIARNAELDAQAARTALSTAEEARASLDDTAARLSVIREGRSDNATRARTYREQVTTLTDTAPERAAATQEAQDALETATTALNTAQEELTTAETRAGEPVALDAIAEAGAIAKQTLTDATTALNNARETQTAADKDVAVQTSETQRLATITTERDKLTRHRATMDKDLKVLNRTVEALSPSGVPRMIMNSEVDALNAELDYQLAKLSGGQLTASVATTRETKSGTTRNELTISVTAPDGTRAYETFSGGQKFLTDLALHQAMSKTLKDNRGKAVQTLFVDEGIGALEGEPKAAAIRGIMAMGTEHYDMSLVVTHDPDVVAAFPDHIEVTMQSGTSIAQTI